MVALLGSVIMLLVVGASSNVSPMHGFWAFGFVDQTQCFCATMFGCSGDALLKLGEERDVGVCEEWGRREIIVISAFDFKD